MRSLDAEAAGDRERAEDADDHEHDERAAYEPSVDGAFRNAHAAAFAAGPAKCELAALRRSVDRRDADLGTGCGLGFR